MRLEDFGWSPLWETALQESGNGLVPARVTEEHKALYRVVSERGEIAARLSGRFRHQRDKDDRPAVGDWVLLGDGGLIRDVLPRTTVLRRKVAASATQPQVVAANVDFVFVVTSLNRDFNPRRLERYLALVWESGARPVVVLSKSDLCDDPEALRMDAEDVAIGVPVHALSALRCVGVDQLEPYLGRAVTIALIGTSGVGKSTLINTLAGADLQLVRQIRKDTYRGRHTTTSRQMLRLSGGALLIDTPGMRELALWDSDDGVASTFSDIEELGRACRFRDCRHRSEPGCAIHAAISDGTLEEERWNSYRKLNRELAHLRRKQRQRDMLEAKRLRRR